MPFIELHNKDGEVVDYAHVDYEDVGRVAQRNWSISNGYARCSYRHPDGKVSTLPMARFILGLEHGDKRVVDHINHDTLDNRRRNLRIVSNVENARNRVSKHKKCAGVYLISKGPRRVGQYVVQIKINGGNKHVGYFNNEADAIAARRAAVRKYWPNTPSAADAGMV